MTRRELEDRYLPDADGLITIGDFKGQRLYVPHVWREAKEDGLVPDDGEHRVTLLVSRGDREMFPELKSRRYIVLATRNGSFVREEV